MPLPFLLPLVVSFTFLSPAAGGLETAGALIAWLARAPQQVLHVQHALLEDSIAGHQHTTLWSPPVTLLSGSPLPLEPPKKDILQKKSRVVEELAEFFRADESGDRAAGHHLLQFLLFSELLPLHGDLGHAQR